MFSLSDLRKITPEGVTFRSHIDGSSHLFHFPSGSWRSSTPSARTHQASTRCIPFPSSRDYAAKSCRLTTEWAARCRETHEKLNDGFHALFGITQGSVFHDLREQSIRDLAAMDFPGYAVGGLAVGESKEEMA